MAALAAALCGPYFRFSLAVFLALVSFAALAFRAAQTLFMTLECLLRSAGVLCLRPLTEAVVAVSSLIPPMNWA